MGRKRRLEIMSMTSLRPRRLAAALLIVMTLTAALCLAGCAVMRAVRTRLPKPRPTPQGVLFQYDALAAREVNLAGNFNNWGGTQGGGRFDPRIDPMTSDEKGVWKVYIPLPPGRYQYKFVIDQVRWEKDPSNPDVAQEGGFENSLVVVPEGVKYDVPFLSLTTALEASGRASVAGNRVEVEFSLDAPEAKNVFVAGTFNNWVTDKDRLKKDAQGIWRVKLSIPAGKHEYKFMVDGQWKEDPANPNKVSDPYGGSNSVIEVSE
jgi:1,4-alpha-glucan branching enzyme